MVPIATKVCIIGGAGHVGLPLGLVLADAGFAVHIHDRNQAALEKIAAGVCPFEDEGMEPLLKSALASGRLTFSTRPSDVAGNEIFVITVGTPVDEFMNPHYGDLTDCLGELDHSLRGGELLILRSTVSPGTTAWVDRYFQGRGKRVDVAFCPERVVQGNAVRELRTLAQLASGTTPAARERAVAFCKRFAPDVHVLDPVEAELAKLFNNAYRYVVFAVANQFYMIANSVGVDYERVRAASSLGYPRGDDIPGAGFTAGPCLFKDTMQLSAFANNQFTLGHQAMAINEGLVLYLVDRMSKKFDLSTMTVGLLGMAFKANSDDTRSSLSYKLKKCIARHCKRVITTDPHVVTDPELLPLAQVLAESDVLVLCVPHAAYRGLDVGTTPSVDIWGGLGRGTFV